MPKLTFTIETGQPDLNGDVVKLDGVKLADKVLLTKDFDHEHPLGPVEINREGDELKATAEIPDDLLDCHPAIGFQIIKRRKEGDLQIFEEIKLHYVGLCFNHNTNPAIKTIREQTA